MTAMHILKMVNAVVYSGPGDCDFRRDEGSVGRLLLVVQASLHSVGLMSIAQNEFLSTFLKSRTINNPQALLEAYKKDPVDVYKSLVSRLNGSAVPLLEWAASKGRWGHVTFLLDHFDPSRFELTKALIRALGREDWCPDTIPKIMERKRVPFELGHQLLTAIIDTKDMKALYRLEFFKSMVEKGAVLEGRFGGEALRPGL
jgi:hypothetical protein